MGEEIIFYPRLLVRHIYKELKNCEDAIRNIENSKNCDADIKKLKEIVNYYVGLGISIKDSYALNDFHKSRKPENLIMGLGVDATHSFFKQNKYLDPFKEIIIKSIKNNQTIKKFSKIISNRGLSL